MSLHAAAKPSTHVAALHSRCRSRAHVLTIHRATQFGTYGMCADTMTVCAGMRFAGADTTVKLRQDTKYLISITTSPATAVT
mgnify:CR=1 FL=1